VSQRKALVTRYLRKKQVAVSWLLQAVELSRNAWYHQVSEATSSADAPIVEQIKAVLIESPYYGYRRVTKELKRQNQTYNHKRILRIMGETLLIQPRKRRTAPKTTNSNHNYTVYTNEIKYLDVLIPSTVWVADITYIPVGDKWCYAAIVLDQCTRKVVGWSLATHMRTSLCTEALDMALKHNQAPLFHHSDRGGQYCSHEYQEVLKKYNIKPSMADVGLSVDNPFAESFNRSLKVEEVYLNVYENVTEARASIAEYIECYNTKRLHSSLGYVPPVEFEANYQIGVS
jgi:transposase InsO family protein